MTQKQLVYLFAVAVSLYFLYVWWKGSSSASATPTANTSDAASPAQPIFTDDDGEDY